MQDELRESETRSTGSLIVVALILAATAALVLVWSHFKIFWVDELLVLETDTVRSFGDVINVQRTMPVSLDPIMYHLVSHAMTLLFGATAFAIRLPSLLGFLAMQLAVFVFVRRAAGVRSALVAMLVPVLTGSMYYAAEARPYGMLLGVFGLTMVSYQAATRDAQRALALVGLALGLMLSPNTHYFGVLLYLPVGVAELARIVSRRRIDWAIVGAYFVGLLGVAGTLPFQKAVARFRLHYYNIGQINVHTIPQSYRLMLVNLPIGPKADRDVLALIFVGFLVAIFVCVRMRERGEVALPVGEWTLLLMLALLPVFGYLLGRFVTHSMEDRYVLGAVLGLSAIVGISLRNVLRSASAFRVAMAVLVIAAAAIVTWRVKISKAKSDALMAGMTFSPERKAQLLSAPDHLIWFEEGGSFQVMAYYEPDPEVKAHLAMFYSADEEMRFRGRETESLATTHLLKYTTLHFVPYEEFRASQGPHVVVVHPQEQWDWSTDAFAADGAAVAPMGQAFDGDAVLVRFP